MTLSEFLFHIAFCCCLFGGLIVIVMWRDRYQVIDTSEEGKL